MEKFIPVDPHEITPEWLTAALRESGSITQAAVQSVSSSALETEHGMTGNLVRLRLAYDPDEASAPRTLVAKFSTRDPAGQEVLFTVTHHYEREHRFYEKLSGRTQLRTPRCYYSDIDIEARKYILLMEDMAPVKSGNMAVGCSIEQAELALREIAGFHAAWWDSPELETMTWMPEFGETQLSQYAGMFRAAWEPFCQKMGERLPAGMSDIDLLLNEHVGDIWSHITQPPWTVVHADYHIENLFFMPAGSAERLLVADWQMMMFGRAAFDVGLLLGGNLDPQVRAQQEMGLLSLYHKLLLENGVKDYSFEQFYYDYHIAILASLSRWMIAMGLFMPPEQVPQAWDGPVSRYFAAVQDLDLGALLPIRIHISA